jgi:nucleoside-diphosphate-sugar epimerase
MKRGSILVTGAGGFVCSEIALALRRADFDVVATDQLFDTATAARLAGLRRVEGPLHDVLGSGDVGQISAVIHGAAITASPKRLGLTNAAHIQRNMDLLTATLALAADAGADRFLFISSRGVFEPHDVPVLDALFTEATQPTATCAYCAAKRAGELLVAAAADDGFITQSLRLGNIFGPHEAVRESRQHLCLVSRMIAEAQSDRVITVHTPNALREWSWLPDLADGIVSHLKNLPANGPPVLHAGSPPVIGDLALAHLIAARVPGAAVRPALPPHDPIRPPMGSNVPSVLAGMHWTVIATALDQLTAEACVS